MKVVYEPQIAEHDPALYVSDRIAHRIAGWDAVDEEVIKQYEDEGYLIIGNAFNPTEVEQAKTELSDMTRADEPLCESVYLEGTIRQLPGFELASDSKRANDKGLDKLAMGAITDRLPDLPAEVRAAYVRKFMGFTASHPALHRLASHPMLLRIIRRLCKFDDVELFQEMAMIKPPGGREKPWHQDHAYFNYPVETKIVGVWIALGDVDERNGCMYLLPGVHRQGPILHFMKRDWQICDSEIYNVLAGKRVCAPMKAGDLLIFDSKLPHGTPRNNTDGYRWAVQLHYKVTAAKPCGDEERLEFFGSEGKHVTC